MKKISAIILLFALPVLIIAQNIPVLRSVSGTGYPELTWYSFQHGLKPGYSVFRAPVGTDDFRPVNTTRLFSERNDTTFFTVSDTTLEKKGLYMYYIEVSDPKGTVLKSDVIYGHNMGSIPSPAVTDFTATSDTTRKALHIRWKLNYSFSVKSFALFRSRHYDRDFVCVATLPADTTGYTDPVAVSNEPYFYFLLISDYFGYQLPSVVIHGICTYAEKPYPPQDFAAAGSGEAVRLSWRRLGSNVIGYRVFRSGTEGRFTQISPMLPPDSLASYTDTTANIPGVTRARYYAVAVSDGYLDSNPTDTLEVALPWNTVVEAPAEADHVIDSAGHIMLLWTLPETPGVSGYNVYRSYRNSEPRKINSVLIPAETNTFTDNNPMGYGAYDYYIESVGPTGRSSAAQTVVHANLPVPGYHVVLTAVASDQGIVISWAPPGFPDLDAFYFYRKEGSAPARMAAMVKPGAGTWTDSGVKPGVSYIYTLVAEFRDGGRLLVNDGILAVKE